MLCYSIVMGFMFAIADLPEVQVAIAQPLVPALALGMSAVIGTETLSWVAGLGIACSIGGGHSLLLLCHYATRPRGGFTSMQHALGAGVTTACDTSVVLLAAYIAHF